MIRLGQETTRSQIDAILASIRTLLEETESVEPNTAEARFVGFGELSLTIEIISYIRTREFGKYLQVQEQLCLSFLGAIDEAGAKLATGHHLVSNTP